MMSGQRNACGRTFILLCFFLSGAVGLIYEIVWMKMLTLVIGNTVFSVTTVLTAFMGGLALGSYLAGRLIDKSKNPLRIFGVLEGIIGAYALVLPLLIAGTEPLFRFIYQNFEMSFYSLSLLRFLICGILLLLPTTLMGATFPVLSKYFVERKTHLGWTIGKLYGVNTFGAVLGSFGAGFILIPLLGRTWTIYSAAFINLSIGAAVLLLNRAGNREKLEKNRQRRKKEGVGKEKGRSSLTIGVVMIGIGLSGVAAMIYQIAWTRVFTLFIGSSVYAFSLIVTSFICGLALGSLVIARFIDRRRNLIMGLALVEGIIGISALLMVPILGKLPVFAAEVVLKFLNSFEHLHLAEFSMVFLLTLVPTFMMGAAFPIATKICATDLKRLGKHVGNVYAANTLGAIIGSFAAGFLLIPWLGTQNSILVAIAINFTAASIIFLRIPTILARWRVAGPLAAIVIVTIAWKGVPSWDTLTFTSGPYLYAEVYKNLSEEKGIGLEAAMKEGRKLLYYKEGLHAVVSVKETTEGDISLELSGKADATAKEDAPTQLMLGHLPLMLHQGAEEVLVIGLGSGMTAGAVGLHPAKKVDVVEIEPAVVEASEYFRAFTRDPLNDLRVNLIIGDGRNHLALTDQEYDVIISEPSNPWISGMSNLFTREFFDLAKRHLREDGLMCQWVHAYSMSSKDFKTIVRTFHAVFPHTSLWEAEFANDYLLIGSVEDLNIDYEVLSNRLSEVSVRGDVAKLGITDPSSFIGKLIMLETEIGRYTKGGQIHTDNNALLEYSAPKNLLKARSTLLFEEIYRNRSNPASIVKAFGWDEHVSSIEDDLPKVFESKRELMDGYIHLVQGDITRAIKKFERARALNPKDYDAAYLLAQLYYDIGERYKHSQRFEEALNAYNMSIDVIEDFVAGDRGVLFQHFEMEVLVSLTYLQVGVISLNSNSLQEAENALQMSLEGEVRYAEAHSNLGVAYERKGNLDKAKEEYQRALEINPDYVQGLINLGNIFLAEEMYNKAIDHYLKVLKQKPDFAMANYNLGVAYYHQGDWARAEREWMHALELNPIFPEARRNLDALRKKMKGA